MQKPHELVNVKTAEVQVTNTTSHDLLTLEKQDLISNQAVEEFLRFATKNTELITVTSNILWLHNSTNNFRLIGTRYATVLLPVQCKTYKNDGYYLQPNDIVCVEYVDIVGMNSLVKINNVAGWLPLESLLQKVQKNACVNYFSLR
jgi:hypothetical protein